MPSTGTENSFSPLVVKTLKGRQHRCSLCLNPCCDALHSCHIIDQDKTTCSTFLDLGKRKRLIQDDFKASADYNGFLLCPTCHSVWMKHDGNPPRLAFVPCAEICTYLLSKLKEDPDSVVDQIISELRVGNGTRVETRRAYAFLDLYQVISFPGQVAGKKDVIATRHYTRLSKYNPSSKNIVLDSTGNLRIFDSAADSLAKALRDFIFIEQPRVDGTKDGSKLYFHLPETSVGAFLTITAHYYLHLPKPENCEPAFIELMSYMASQERSLSSRKQVGGNKKQNKQNKKRRKTPTEQPRMKRKKLDDEDSDDDNNDEPSSKRRQTKTGKFRGKKPADANTTEKKGTRSSSGNDQRSGIKRNYVAPKPERDLGRPPLEAGLVYGPDWTSSRHISTQAHILNPAPWLMEEAERNVLTIQ